MQAKLAAHLVFRTHISTRSCIVSNKDHSEAGRHSSCFQFSNVMPKINVNFLRNSAAIDKFWHREAGNPASEHAPRKRALL